MLDTIGQVRHAYYDWSWPEIAWTAQEPRWFFFAQSLAEATFPLLTVLFFLSAVIINILIVVGSIVADVEVNYRRHPAEMSGDLPWYIPVNLLF